MEIRIEDIADTMIVILLSIISLWAGFLCGRLY